MGVAAVAGALQMIRRKDERLAELLLARRRELRVLLGDERYAAEVAGIRPLVIGYRDEHGCVNGLQAAQRMCEELVAAGKATPLSINLLLVAGAFETRDSGANR